MLFHKFDDVYNCKTSLYIMVDNDYKSLEHQYVSDFLSLNMNAINNLKRGEGTKDFIDNLHPKLLLYFKFYRTILLESSGPKASSTDGSIVNKVFIFKKNKLYKFNNEAFGETSFYDEVGTPVNSSSQYNDLWYEPFVFVHEEDMDQAIRYLKLKEITDESR